MLARRGDELAGRSEGLAVRSEQLAARNDDLVAHSKSVAQRSDELAARTEQIGDRLLQLAEAGDLAASDLETVRAHLRELSDRLHATPYVADPSLFAAADVDGRPMIGYTLNGNGRDPEPKNDYRAFEDVFRGPEPFIRERQRYYVDFLRGHEPVVDVGCGRGEMPSLLAEAGIPAVGVDLDPGMVEHCREQDLPVVLGDALDYLETQGSGTLGAIFPAQVIEHLSYDGLIRLFTLAYEKLNPSGVFIAETVNPHSVHAFKAFWVDPTHRVPIFPEVAVALCRFTGFHSAVVRFPNGNGELEHDRRNQGEYAVVAQKASMYHD